MLISVIVFCNTVCVGLRIQFKCITPVDRIAWDATTTWALELICLNNRCITYLPVICQAQIIQRLRTIKFVFGLFFDLLAFSSIILLL